MAEQNENIRINITDNGTTVLATAGKYCERNIALNVNVAAEAPTLQEKTLEITENGTTEIAPDSGNDGLSKVTVTVAIPEPDAEIIDATELPTSDIDTEAYYRMNGKLYKYIEADLTSPEGTWIFDDERLYSFCSNIGGLDFGCVFTSNGESCTRISIMKENSGFKLYYYASSSVLVATAADETITWVDDNYKTLVVSSCSIGNFLSSTATKQAENTWLCYLIPTDTLEITENGTVDVTDKKEVVVNVASPSCTIPSGTYRANGDPAEPTSSIEESDLGFRVTLADTSAGGKDFAGMSITADTSHRVNVSYVATDGSETAAYDGSSWSTSYKAITFEGSDGTECSQAFYDWFMATFTNISSAPIEATTEDEMTLLLQIAADNAVQGYEGLTTGSVVKYTGTTGTYENGGLYIVEEAT